MSMYEKFRTDEVAEKEGIWLDYGDFRIRVARAGGSNRDFARTLETKMRPYMRAQQLGLLSEDISGKVLRETYAVAVVRDWRVRQNGGWEPGIEGPEGDVLPFNADNVLATFEKLPELFADVLKQTREYGGYLVALREEAAKNLSGASSTP